MVVSSSYPCLKLSCPKDTRVHYPNIHAQALAHTHTQMLVWQPVSGLFVKTLPKTSLLEACPHQQPQSSGRTPGPPSGTGTGSAQNVTTSIFRTDWKTRNQPPSCPRAFSCCSMIRSRRILSWTSPWDFNIHIATRPPPQSILPHPFASCMVVSYVIIAVSADFWHVPISFWHSL